MPMFGGRHDQRDTGGLTDWKGKPYDPSNRTACSSCQLQVHRAGAQNPAIDPKLGRIPNGVPIKAFILVEAQHSRTARMPVI